MHDPAIPPGHAALATPERIPPRSVKLFYSLGQFVQAGGFDTALVFAFFYYTAVLGLSGSLVGLALGASLVVDAIIDPLIGSWSDNIRSRYGRRLPLMAAAVPLVGISVGMLFAPPPGLSPTLLAVWLASSSIAARVSISLFNVPYIALGAELADGYDERTRIVAWRTVAGIFSGVIVVALAYSVYFSGEGGLQRAGSYPGFGWAVSLLLVAAMTICCLGTARHAGTLPQVVPVETGIYRRLGGEIAEIFRNRSFRQLFGSAVVVYVAVGLNATFNNHIYIFVWHFTPGMIQTIAYVFLAGMLCGVPLAPRLIRHFEKRTVLIAGVALLVATWLVLPLTRASGLVSAIGNAALPPMLASTFVAGIAIGLCVIAFPSMMADAADEHALLFGRRREGLYFAGIAFAAKAASGLGVALAGEALDLTGIPSDAGKTIGIQLAEPMLVKLVLVAAPVPAVIASIGIVFALPYAISRATHALIAARLRGATA